MGGKKKTPPPEIPTPPQTAKLLRLVGDTLNELDERELYTIEDCVLVLRLGDGDIHVQTNVDEDGTFLALVDATSLYDKKQET